MNQHLAMKVTTNSYKYNYNVGFEIDLV